MTPDERERTMDFILRQQAQFEVNLQREREERLNDRLNDMPRIARVEACVIKLTELAEIQSQRLDECQKLHHESLVRLDRILERLSDKN